jgi:hypothetical protein
MILPGPYTFDPYYRKFYQEAEGFKLLDNGEAEGSPCPLDKLFDIAYKVKADEIVIPDTIKDWRATVQQANEFRPYAENHREYRYMGVVQGDDYESFSRCLEGFILLDYIDTIGVPRHMVQTLGSDAARIGFVDMMDAEFASMPVHCLGANSNVKEVQMLKHHRNVRGIDTSLPFVLGIENVDIETGLYFDRQPDFFERSILPGSPLGQQCHANLAKYRGWTDDYNTETPFSRV